MSTPAQPLTGSQKIHEALNKLAPILAKFGEHWQQSRGGAQVQSEARVGGPSPDIVKSPVGQGLNITYDPSRAGGSMSAPVGQPARPGYSPSPYGAQMMEKLSPSGGSVFSAVQGVSKLLQDWRQRKDQSQQAEAANIASKLMSAIEKSDTATVYDILNDPKATKVLNKVYKGWLTKAQESQKTPDVDVKGFEAGLQQYVQGRAQQAPAMPRQAGGYLLPQASPVEQLRGAQISAESQAAQQDPARLLASQMTSRETGQAERIASQLGVSPREMAVLEARTQSAMTRGYFDLLRSAAIQDAVSARAAKTQADITARAKMVEEIRKSAKLGYGKIIRGAKKGDDEDVMFKVLKEQIDSATRLRNNANSAYERLVGKDDDAAKAMQAQTAELDTKIQRWNDQMDSLKNRKMMQDIFMYLLTPDEKEGVESSEEEPPK